MIVINSTFLHPTLAIFDCSPSDGVYSWGKMNVI